jgi:hypothetical protein
MSKYSSLTRGQGEAIFNMIVEAGGGDEEVLQALLRREKKIILEDAIRLLFDQHGRRIPPQGMKAHHCDPDRSFSFIQPNLATVEDYAKRFARLRHLWTSIAITPEEFSKKANELREDLRGQKQISNLLNGVCLPIVLPPLPRGTDYGLALEWYVAAVGLSYMDIFPERQFTNHRAGDLAQKVTIVHPSHERLINRLQDGETIVALHFLNPLHGFSVLAAREQMSDLPDSLYLAGGLDTAIGGIIYPDILFCDYHTPGLDCAAVQWQESDYSLYFEAYDAHAYFALRTNLGCAHDCCSGGLLFSM